MRGAAGKDLHAVLGVDEKAGPEELRRAYLALAVKYHPDRNPGDREAEERFKDISQAYAVLSDPAARARYERMRPKKTGKTAGPSPSSPGGKSSAASSGSRSGASGASSGPKTSASAGGASSSGPGRASGREASGRAEASAGADSGSSGASPGQEPEFEEILSEFFKTPKGRDTLRDLEGALGQAGIKFRMDDFTNWFKGRRETPSPPQKPATPLWERLTAKLPGAGSRARKKAERYDINYQLALTPQAAASGTTVEISYQRDDGPHHLKVRIPAGAKDGSRLRLGGQGMLKPDHAGRGDLVLTVTINQPLDLWK